MIAGEVGAGGEEEGGDGRKGAFVVSSSTDGVLKVWSLEFFQVLIVIVVVECYNFFFLTSFSPFVLF